MHQCVLEIRWMCDGAATIAMHWQKPLVNLIEEAKQHMLYSIEIEKSACKQNE